ncbi:MAG: hypothetical protein Q8L53_16725 [Aestuariivirga sp.]|nr:hypothetical protein [Aestuariivirga sp.]
MDVLNVVPSQTGFRPFPAFSGVTGAITARAQGAISVRGLQGTIYTFCGDATKLYKLDSDGLAWTDVSRLAGGAYSTAADSWWDFFIFGDVVIAQNGNDAPQIYQLDVSTNFAALGGTPPTASFGGVVRDFAILAKRNTAFNRLTWSAFADAEDWVASATTLSDAQDFYEGGQIMGFVGGEYGLVFLEKSIFRMAFEGPPTVFRFDKISNQLGCRAERSVAAYENLAFFLSDDGPYMIRGGSEIIAIGTEKVDKWIEDNLDASYLYRISSAIDPIRMCYIMGFASESATMGSPDTLLLYHWPTGQWSKVAVEHEIIYSGLTQSGYTIDGLDALSATIDGLPFPVDSRFYAGDGILLLAWFNTDHEQGFFTGTNLPATIETGDAQLIPGRKALLRALRPMVEGSNVTPSVAIKYRDRLQDNHTTGSPVATNANGICTFRHKARYHRAICTIPAAAAWTFATGVDDLRFSAMGKR